MPDEAVTTPATREHDVVVVGARCAGAATALLLARQGHDVALVDRTTFPSDTLSTHSIARGGVVQLARWGLLDEVVASGAPRIRNVSFHAAGERIDRPVKPTAGVDHLLAPRRYVLDAILVRAAEAAGAELTTGLTVTDVVRNSSGRVTGVASRSATGATQEIRARLVIGADGVRSRIARAVEARVLDDRPSDSATHYAYVAGLDARTDGFEFHVGQGAFAGVFSTHGGEANVWVCHQIADDGAVHEDRVAEFVDVLDRAAPELAGRVRAADITSPVRAAIRFPNQIRQAAGRGWALVGDAGYARDPITGHGITDAFRDAELLAARVGEFLRGQQSAPRALSAYANQRDRALRPIFELTTRLTTYPPPDTFTELQVQLSRVLEEEATWLAGRPPLFAPSENVAA